MRDDEDGRVRAIRGAADAVHARGAGVALDRAQIVDLEVHRYREELPEG